MGRGIKRGNRFDAHNSSPAKQLRGPHPSFSHNQSPLGGKSRPVPQGRPFNRDRVPTYRRSYSRSWSRSSSSGRSRSRSRSRSWNRSRSSSRSRSRSPPSRYRQRHPRRRLASSLSLSFSFCVCVYIYMYNYIYTSPSLSPFLSEAKLDIGVFDDAFSRYSVLKSTHSAYPNAWSHYTLLQVRTVSLFTIK